VIRIDFDSESASFYDVEERVLHKPNTTRMSDDEVSWILPDEVDDQPTCSFTRTHQYTVSRRSLQFRSIDKIITACGRDTPQIETNEIVAKCKLIAPKPQAARKF